MASCFHGNSFPYGLNLTPAGPPPVCNEPASHVTGIVSLNSSGVNARTMATT